MSAFWKRGQSWATDTGLLLVGKGAMQHSLSPQALHWAAGSYNRPQRTHKGYSALIFTSLPERCSPITNFELSCLNPEIRSPYLGWLG